MNKDKNSIISRRLTTFISFIIIIKVHNGQIVFCLTKFSLWERQLTRSKIIVQSQHITH